MKRNKRIAFIGLLIASCVLVIPSAHADVNLTGMTLWQSNQSDGQYAGHGANTLGADIPYNIYLKSGGSWINSGDVAAASLNYALGPGTYSFDFWHSQGYTYSYGAMNLFFDGNNSTPGISVATPMDTTNSFQQINTVYSLPLDFYQASIVYVQAANSLTFIDGNFAITLTDFRYFTPETHIPDLVRPYNNLADGWGDYYGSFTLTVSTVSEPVTMLLLGFGLAGLAGVRKYKP